MSEKMTVSLSKEVWDRFEQLAEEKKEESVALMESVLVAYLNNEETDEGVECNINFLGTGTLDPC